MLFRSGHDGTFASPVLIFTFPLSAPRRNCGLVSFSLLSLALGTTPHSATAAPARNKPFKPVGVEAWTSGSQTFIRARPSAAVPPVAKVGRHTPLHVWGKYNGWYRVETHDHIFGWVFNPYLNSPGLDKVREMPRSKARLASNRTANQTMYGTPALLKQHFATYGAKGALVGLQKQGVYLAVAPKRRTVLAATDAASKTSSKTEVSTAKPRPRLAAAPRRVESAAPTKMASPVPVIEMPRRATGTSRTAAAARPAPVEVPNPAATVPSATTPSVAPLVAPSVVAPREVEVGQIAGASRDLVPSARSFARAAGEAASQPTPRTVAPQIVVPQSVTPSVKPPVAASAVAVAPVPRAVPAKPRVVAKPKVVKAKKPVAKASRRSRLSASKARKRELLRNQMGLSPAPMPPTVIAPVSPAELLKARQEYLSERKARLNPPAAQAGTSPITPPVASPGTPVGNLAPLPPPSGPLGGTPGDSTGTALPPAPPALQPMAWPGQGDRSLSPLYPILAHPMVVALSQIKPQAPQSVAKTISPARTTPNSAAPALRGGSPRDRFGSGMASQALSYRGMRYIRGAASPSRGFDCSGLIYFLLRQRGYKPPRTAAGYRTWGQSVPRGQWQPGDLVLFANTYKRGVSHIGVYLGQNKFVHAATSGTGVRVSSLGEKYYARKYFGARRAKMTAR